MTTQDIVSIVVSLLAIGISSVSIAQSLRTLRTMERRTKDMLDRLPAGRDRLSTSLDEAAQDSQFAAAASKMGMPLSVIADELNARKRARKI